MALVTKRLFVVGLLSIAAAVSSAGSNIFSTNDTATPTFFPANGTNNTSSIFHAFQFTVGAGNDGVLDQLVVAGQSGTAFTETFDILNDSAGSPGSLLDTILVTVIGDSVSRLYSGSSANNPTLSAGTSYWVEATSPSGTNAFFWLEANPIVTTSEFSSASGTFAGQSSAAFALLSSGVPEPATWPLMLALPLAFHFVRRRTR